MAEVYVPGEKAAVAQPVNPVAVNPVAVNQTNAPPGAPPGGHYEEIKYCGVISWVIALFFGVCACVPCCPCDSQEYYRAPDGSLWTSNGSRVSKPFLAGGCC